MYLWHDSCSVPWITPNLQYHQHDVDYTRSLQCNFRPLLPKYQPLCFQYYSPPILLSHPSNIFPVAVTSDPHLAAPLLHPHFPEPSQAQYCKVITLVTILTQGSFSCGTSPLPSSCSSPNPALPKRSFQVPSLYLHLPPWQECGRRRQAKPLP